MIINAIARSENRSHFVYLLEIKELA